MDIVYICRDGENEELRYSIRSVVENYPHDNIWVVGGKPSWYSGNYIKVEQDALKYVNARRNMLAILNSPEISEDFVLMNDDFYIIKPIEVMSNYASGLLYTKMKKYRKNHSSSYYTRLISNTYEKLRKGGMEVGQIIDYDIHVPIVINKQKFSEIFTEQIFLWRSLYGNKFFTNYEIMDDIKLYLYNVINDLKQITSGDGLFLSSDDSTCDYIIEKYLKNKFPNPSKYEANYLYQES